MKSNIVVSGAHLGEEPQRTQPACPSSPSRGQPLLADALEALEKRVAAALRQMQQRQEQSLDEAIQLLVGQLWAAYFSIGSLQAHQQQLQAQLQQFMGGAQGVRGGGAALPAMGDGGGGAAEGPEAGGNGDSAGSETVSVTLSDLDDDCQEVQCYPHARAAAATPPSAQPPPETACLSGGSQATGHDHRERHAPQTGHVHASHNGGSRGGGGGLGGGGTHRHHHSSGGPSGGSGSGSGGSGSGGSGSGGSRKRDAELDWEMALKKERSKRRRLEKEVRELKGLLEALLPHVK